MATPKTPPDSSPTLHLLEPRHVDNLTDAIRNQNRISAERLELERRQNADTKALVVSVDDLKASIDRLVKVLDVSGVLDSQTTPSGRMRSGKKK